MTSRHKATPALDVDRVRADFPALAAMVNGHELAYLDSASTAQKPQQVLDAMRRYDVESCANVHRGVHTLSATATRDYEAVRDKARALLGAGDRDEIVFTSGTTESINLIAQSLGRARLGAGDAVLVTALEHHSNLVPWQLLCAATGAELVALPLDADGALRTELLDEHLTARTRIVALSHVSNALGTIAPVAEIARAAHAVGAVVVVDGAQAVPHQRVDVAALGCDFYAFSGHKLFGPTGVGVLWGRRELLEEMPPWQGGGEMIAEVTLRASTFREPPYRFEAGTPNIAGVIGLGAAIDYVNGIGHDAIAAHGAELLAHASRALVEVPDLRLIGTAEPKAAVVSFALGDAHPHDVGTILDLHGVAVRTGHHCAQPAIAHFGLEATVRASFALYNTRAEIERLVAALHEAREALR